jgi:hypothetical protein
VGIQAKNLYVSWTERGPKGALYACSSSGWFDSCLFEQWFFKLLLPILKRRVGRKLLIGDNLASHLSPAVIEACRRNNIQFVCLPPNSTDKLQPLDVGVFGPLKAAWRSILTAYKQQHPSQVGINKTDFPGLLNKLLEKAKPGQHLPAAFEKCGLYPVNRDRAVERIPHREMETENENAPRLMDSTLGEKLEALRGVGRKTPQKRGKKIKVPPGKSYTEPIEDKDEDKDKEEDEELPNLNLEDLQEEEEVVVRARKSLSQAKKHRVVVETSDEELPDLEEEEEVAVRARKSLPKSKRMVAGSDEELLDVDDPLEGSSKDFRPLDQYVVGSFVVAVYEKA